MKAFGRKLKWAASICAYSLSATRWVQTSVYNVNTKTWIASSELVEDIEQGKERAASRAEAYLKQIANLELPPLVWKRSRSA